MIRELGTASVETKGSGTGSLEFDPVTQEFIPVKP